jgi:hypothetical protein
VTFDHRERDYQREGENKISNREKKKKWLREREWEGRSVDERIRSV